MKHTVFALNTVCYTLLTKILKTLKAKVEMKLWRDHSKLLKVLSTEIGIFLGSYSYLVIFYFHQVTATFKQNKLQELHEIRTTSLLKYRSEEKGSSLCKCSILLGFIMSKKLQRLGSELLSEDKITNLLGFLT